MTTRPFAGKAPTRAAPGLPVGLAKSVKEATTAEPDIYDPFSPVKLKQVQDRKKAPPPRPPPPRLHMPAQTSRSIFGSSKKKAQKPAAPATAIVKPLPPSQYIPTGTLIDLDGSPESPQFPVKLKETSGFNCTFQKSQSESGFEDDFSSIISSGATTPGPDPWSSTSSPTTTPSPDFIKYGSLVKSDTKFKSASAKTTATSRPTIICVPSSGGGGGKLKPSRPPPPGTLSRTTTNDDETFERGSPPMPSIPPPPPPPEILDVLERGPPVPPRPVEPFQPPKEEDPYCIAAYDYESNHPDDLSFKQGDIIIITDQVSEEWLKGRLKGLEGLFPTSYVDIKVPLTGANDNFIMKAIAVFPFHAETWDDLDLNDGDIVDVICRVDKNWFYGVCDGKRGQFPACVVQDITDLE